MIFDAEARRIRNELFIVPPLREADVVLPPDVILGAETVVVAVKLGHEISPVEEIEQASIARDVPVILPVCVIEAVLVAPL